MFLKVTKNHVKIFIISGAIQKKNWMEGEMKILRTPVTTDY